MVAARACAMLLAANVRWTMTYNIEVVQMNGRAILWLDLRRLLKLHNRSHRIIAVYRKNLWKKQNVSYSKREYLISTPVPHRYKRWSDQDSGPWKIRANWISQNMKRVGTRQPAKRFGHISVEYIGNIVGYAGVGQPYIIKTWNGLKIFYHKSLDSSNLHESLNENKLSFKQQYIIPKVYSQKSKNILCVGVLLLLRFTVK